MALMLEPETAKRVAGIERFEDRALLVKLKAEPVDPVIVQVYMPTTDHEELEVDLWYERLEEMLGGQKGTDNVVIMGDWNAVVGEGRDEKEVGSYGLGKRNERGEKLVEFCKKNKLMITNTWFEQEKRRRYTWKKPGDTGRFQIDYILVKQRFRNSVKSSWSYPGADMDSDHNLVAMKVNVKLKKISKGKKQMKWDMVKLKTNGDKFCKGIEDNLQCGAGRPIEEQWENLKDTVVRSGMEHIGYGKGRVARKPWVTTKMLETMKERRKWKSRNTEMGKKKYRQLNNELRRDTEKAKAIWWESECKELEDLDRRGRSDLVYAKVGQLTGKNRNINRSITVKDKQGALLNEAEAIRARWKEYIEELYDKSGKPIGGPMRMEDEQDIDKDCKGPAILEREIEEAIREMKNGKAVGVDGIPAEFWKLLGERGNKELRRLCMEVYEKGEWPRDFTHIVMIPIEKKTNAVECGDYRQSSSIRVRYNRMR